MANLDGQVSWTVGYNTRQAVIGKGPTRMFAVLPF